MRHVSDKFVEDPLRVLRGMQFVARFDLQPAPETIALCQTVGIEDLPPERLFEEWAKLLTKGCQIGKGLAFLRATGWVRHFPELQRLIGCQQDPAWHPEGDVWNHTCLCLDAFARRRIGDPDEDLIVGLAVLCHDFGKPATTRFQNGHIRSLGHDEEGVKPTLSFLRRLTNEERILREVPPLVQCHMQPFALWKSKAGDAAIRDFSDILAKASNGRCFVGRNGGNKFLAIFESTTRAVLDAYVADVAQAVAARNEGLGEAALEYDAGSALAGEEGITALTELVALSDRRATSSEGRA